jgi:antitoxin HicB
MMTAKRQVKLRGSAGELARYLSAPYVRMIVPNVEEGGYLAEVLELPGCITEGDTPEEAYRNLEDAMAGWIAASLDTKRPIPEPVGDKEYSGHFPLRMSTELHRAAALRAMQEGVSLNQWIVGAIAAQVAKQNLAVELGDYLLARLASQVRIRQFSSTEINLIGSGATDPSEITRPRVESRETGAAVLTPNLAVLSPPDRILDAGVDAVRDADAKEVKPNA